MAKKLLITGIGRGIGLEFAKQYLADGCVVFGSARNFAQNTSLAALQQDYSQQLVVKDLDVTDAKAVTEWAKELDSAIDILINNAGIYGGAKAAQSLLELDLDDWSKVFQTNTQAPLHMTRSFLPNIQRGNDKKVINITSKMGSIEDNTSGGAYAYRSSKTALNAVVKSLSHDLYDDNITVLACHPGWVQTDMGGPNGLITVAESVSYLRQTIENATINQSGSFFNYNGASIPW